MANLFLFLSSCCDWHLLLIRSCPKFLIRQNICSKVILRSRLRKSDPVIVGWSRDVTHYVSLCPDLFFFYNSYRICREKTFHAASELLSALERTALSAQLSASRRREPSEDQPLSFYVARIAFLDPHMDLKFQHLGTKH